MVNYETIRLESDGPVAWVTLNRPDDGNMFDGRMLDELYDALDTLRREIETRVIVITGAGNKFFCLGGEKDIEDHTLGYTGALPIVSVYELIEHHPKPVIASVNGFAVGGGHVLHVVCDLSIAAESAVFRQVGPAVGSFDAGYGTWVLEDLIGRKRAKEMWFVNAKMTAQDALEIGLVNWVVPDQALREETNKIANTIAERGSEALAIVKASFAARTGGIAGFSRVTQDLLLPHYWRTQEAKELAQSFSHKRSPDTSTYWK